MKIQVRKPDGRILEVLDARPISGKFIYYFKDLYKIEKDEQGSYIIDDYVEPGETPPPFDPELARQIAWFVQNRKEIAEVTGVRVLYLNRD